MYAEKLLPHDLEAEEAVVGSLLIDSDSFVRVAHLIKPEDFYREKNQLCFAACLALFQRGEVIDQVTVAGKLLVPFLFGDIGIFPVDEHHHVRILLDASAVS